MEETKVKKPSIEELKARSNRKSARPMGYIYPKVIQQLLEGEDVKKTVFSMYNPDGERNEKSLERKVWRIPVRKECPHCKKLMRKQIDAKFFAIRGKCFDCVLKDEMKIRLDGNWEEYEKWKISENKLSMFRDIRDEVLDFLNSGLKKEHQFIKEDGSIEKWKNTGYEKTKIFVEDKLKQIDEEIGKLEELLIPLREKFIGNAKS